MHEPRILAIDLRSQRFGFAVLRGPRQLLDSGMKMLHVVDAKDGATAVRKRLVPLLTLFAPSVIVVKRVSGHRRVSRLRNKQIVEAIKREAQERSLELVF